MTRSRGRRRREEERGEEGVRGGGAINYLTSVMFE